MATFRQWQHWRQSGGGNKQTPAEAAIKTLHVDSIKDKK